MTPNGRAGRLVFPALRWRADTGFEHEQEAIASALALGVGGFVIFGGRASAVAQLTGEIRTRADRPMLFASDLERGAGQQFEGATALPPASAIASLNDLDVTRRAGRLTGREALALGVNWVLAPVADVDLEPNNPIVGSRAFGSEPEAVARQVAAWVSGCTEAGALCCAKHFPGHGRTLADSHAGLPEVSASKEQLANDLRPFQAAFGAGATTVMTAHVAYSALDSPTTPATRSAAIVTGLLRRELGFRGLVVTDALIMAGILQGTDSESSAAVASLAAGCDVLLYPQDPGAVTGALEAASAGDRHGQRLAESIARVEAFAARAPANGSGPWGDPKDAEWAEEIGARAIIVAGGEIRAPSELELVTVDDDVGGPYPPPPRSAFAHRLREAGCTVHEVESPTGAHAVVLAVYSDVRGWKERVGLSDAARSACASARTPRLAGTVLFGHPRLADELPADRLAIAWGGEPVMQRAAARRLTTDPGIGPAQ